MSVQSRSPAEPLVRPMMPSTAEPDAERDHRWRRVVNIHGRRLNADSRGIGYDRGRGDIHLRRRCVPGRCRVHVDRGGLDRAGDDGSGDHTGQYLPCRRPLAVASRHGSRRACDHRESCDNCHKLFHKIFGLMFIFKIAALFDCGSCVLFTAVV